jgi:hypothetical protein
MACAPPGPRLLPDLVCGFSKVLISNTSKDLNQNHGSGHGDCTVDQNDKAAWEGDPGYETPVDTQLIRLCSWNENIDDKLICLYPVGTTRVKVAVAQPQTVDLGNLSERTPGSQR